VILMEYILKNGIVYDPANEVNGEKMDICFADGKNRRICIR
jgi:Formylmethanofuran dehydrogenase subunit A